jgi:nucleotide-binding universal stress UspA family protein
VVTRTILVPVDGSAVFWSALEFVTEHHSDATLVVYVVSDSGERTLGGFTPDVSEAIVDASEERAHDLLAEARQRAADHDGPVETDHDRGLPGDQIVAYADDHDVDQIVTGSHGHGGLKRVLLGSVAERVARHAPVPVTIVHRGDEEG